MLDLPYGRSKVIALFARQHPGEPAGSWIMQGFIRFLLGGSARAKELRKKFDWVVLPMVNVDGCVTGTHRCAVAHSDLNRTWSAKCPSRDPVVN